MLTPYRRVLSEPGALAFSGAALVARLPISMIGLGIVLLISTVTGSYGLAGSVSAVFLISNALLTVPQGRLLDQWGQARVLTTAIAVHTVALVLLVVAVQADWPLVTTYAAAALGGATLPAVGPSVRARWSHRLHRPADVATAYALESVLDEVVFIVGPILVTVLATGWRSWSGLAVAIVVGLVGTLGYASLRATQPPARRRSADDGPRPPMPWRAIAAIALVALLLGTALGAAEVITVAFTEEAGVKRWAGFLLALWAAGSLVGGVVTGSIQWQRGPGGRLRWATLGLAVAMAPLPWIGSVAVLAMVLFVGGLAVAPSLIATNSLVEQTVPSGRLSEGMALVHTGIVAGVAPGATLAGLVIDAQGASTAYLIPVVAGVAGALAARLTPR
ncbi:MFS transporter [Nocardioides sp.]|uniref:MFS transporter n=1 Tax=Nocardioides sp. TaxID=35761 RepID=UPI00352788BE